MYDTYAGNMIGGYCLNDQYGELLIEVDGNPAPLTLCGRITASGDTGHILVNDTPIGSGRDLELTDQPGLNEYYCITTNPYIRLPIHNSPTP